MIASVRGTVLATGLDHVVIEVGGVGLLVHTTAGTSGSTRTSAELTLHTTLVVREDSLTLYGFGGATERDLFEQVQTVSGVGPRIALAMLSVHDPDTLRAAISGGDLVALIKVPGIGRKGAERIVLELKDKVAGMPGAVASATAEPPAPAAEVRNTQVVEALTGLGWSAKQAQDAVARIEKQPDAPTEVSALLRAALRDLGR
ncbi:Holliday junction branch migration protein RuvA [Calidifontibacter sp. DB0510]|uniref:Holliday junction branch migration complex subunit RuvA n=1 Tax=Metallococcus carri TaxID=1656884 RepID=A0A967EA16_9MICO|nr:Holliday junction branch migration protein RuvA [Metallococcus carri]NHN56987.1 Holliday junction branch migration protein RuvA [Metallococcus carri]NOP37732.1 Holliday junction branch migration protein RuvA [Calidifontibacter sp. DB2511S]